MRTPHVAHEAAYKNDERVPATHTILIQDDRDECGSATIWTFPRGLPQSIGVAVVASVDTAPGEKDAVPALTIHASHREVIKTYLCEGKLVVDTKGLPLKRNDANGTYEVAL
uniref:Uncharacterized protein n=1 Tax=Pseudomonas fluorescens (strain SBW25) TaxID=216595 RepID=A0A0G4E568_PSEFS|nr:hypothetical protein [Pseudomonas fluorescens]CEK42370.1 hypothetical protein PQBR57_0417 [Pseudomonas fluorescens SBW25]